MHTHIQDTLFFGGGFLLFLSPIAISASCFCFLHPFLPADYLAGTLSFFNSFFLSGHLLDAAKLESALKASLGDVTFHEAYERTGECLTYMFR